MLYKLVSQPSIEQHAENIIHLFVRNANDAPAAGARVKLWAGPPPNGTPAYWNDDQPFRLVQASGMLEFITVTGPMPDTRDYWAQVFDNNGAPQSDPVQFHFPSGSTIWITATLTQEGTPTATPFTGVSTPVNVDLDTRLAPMHVTIQPVNVAAGQAYWKIISAKYQDESEAGGNHNIYFTVLDENGVPIPGVPIFMDWQGRESNDIPASVYTDGNGTGNQSMYHGPVGWRPDDGPGPYFAWVGDPDYRGGTPTKISGEKIMGCGLPLNRHVNFIVTWKKVIAGTVSKPPAPPQPVAGTATTYTVQPGDTLSKIARQFGVTVAAIVAANNIANPSLIKPGQVFKIPKA